MKGKCLKVKACLNNNPTTIKTTLLPNENKELEANVSLVSNKLEISSSLVCGQVIFYIPIILNDGILYIGSEGNYSLVLVKDE